MTAKSQNNKNLFLSILVVIMIFFVVSSYIIKIIVIEKNTASLLNKITSQQKQQLISFLKVNTAYKDGKPLELYRYGRDYDGGYVVPKLALESADVLLGYGIADDSSFEDQFSLMYNKKSYGYDCSIKSVAASSPLFEFVPECIASKDFLYHNSLNSSEMKVTSFSDHLINHNLQDKKIFVKMDIEGAEYDAFDDILWHQSNVTGIVLEIHFKDSNIERAINLLSKLRQNFVLLHVHGNNCVRQSFEASNVIGKVPYVVELSFINKALIDEHYISRDQTNPTELDLPNCKNVPPHRFEIIGLPA